MKTNVLFVITCLFIIKCGHKFAEKGAVHIPEKPGEYPKVTEKKLLRGQLTTYRNSYDVTYYELDIELNINKQSIFGKCTINAVALKNIDTLQIDLFENLNIIEIKQGDIELPYYRIHNAVFIEVSNVIKDDSFTITIIYGGTPIIATNPPWDGGFVWEKDKNNIPFIGVACEGLGASSWWPNKDHPSDEPDSVRLHITVPDTLLAIGNGKLENIRKSDNKTTYSWFVNNPINNYNVSINVGNYVMVEDTLINDKGSQTLSHFVINYNQDTARKYFHQAKDVIHFFEKIFGEYPFWDDGYKLIETPYAGMEHQSGIAYGNGYITSGHYYIYDLVDYIILHETAHEWWGNSLTSCDGADVWIHESFATYSEVLYLEEKLGKLISIDYLIKKRKHIQNKLPIVGPQHVNYWGFDDVYWKGAWVIHTLRFVINNDELFFRMLKKSQEKFRHSVVCTAEFIQFINEMTSMKLNYFFDQYLFDRRPPVFEYYANDTTFNYRWTGVVDNFIMPVGLLVNKEELRVSPTHEFQSINIKKHSLIEILDNEVYIKKNQINK